MVMMIELSHRSFLRAIHTVTAGENRPLKSSGSALLSLKNQYQDRRAIQPHTCSAVKRANEIVNDLT